MGLPYCDVRKFSIIDGLAANTISDIAQTPDRLMWFSTWNGISYYDGNSFHTFRDDADDIDLLSTNRFMSIYATARNNVWCITANRRLYVYETILCIRRIRLYQPRFGNTIRAAYLRGCITA